MSLFPIPYHTCVSLCFLSLVVLSLSLRLTLPLSITLSYMSEACQANENVRDLGGRAEYFTPKRSSLGPVVANQGKIADCRRSWGESAAS